MKPAEQGLPNKGNGIDEGRYELERVDLLALGTLRAIKCTPNVSKTYFMQEWFIILYVKVTFYTINV